MKKHLAFLMVMGLTATTLFGCSTGKQNETKKVEKVIEKTETTKESVQKQTITLGIKDDSSGGTQQIIEQFKEEYPQYDIKWTPMTNDSLQMHDQLLTSLSSGSDEYDVIAMDVVWAGEFASAGYLETLDKRIKDWGYKITDFNKGSMSSGTYKGKSYAMPFYPDLGFLYFRSDIVSKEDAEKLANGDYTLDDLAVMAEKYKGQKDTKYGYVYQSSLYEGLVCNLNEFTKNWTDIKGGLEKMKAFAEADWTPENILSYKEQDTLTAFADGNTVFARNWPYQYGKIKTGEYKVKEDQVGFAPLPDGGTVGGFLLGVNSNSDVKDAAWDFVKYVAGPEGQEVLAIVKGRIPGLNKLLEDQKLIEANQLLTSTAFKLAVKNTIPRPVVANYSEVSDQIQVTAHKYLSGSISLEDTVSKIEEVLGQ